MAHDPWPGQSYDEDENSRYSVNAKIMLSAFICLLAVVLFIILLHLYARCYLRRHFLSHHHRTLPPPTPPTNFPNPPKNGLDPPTIASLPTFLYTHHHTPTIECTVCLSHLEPGETVRLLPNCDHSFHVACIDMWLLSHSTCPVCRTPAEPRVAEPGTGSDQAGASAPPLDNGSGLEDGGSVEGQSSKGSESVSRLSSFRRILIRDRSERRSQASVHPATVEDDIERQSRID